MNTRKLTLVGTGITLPHVDESAARYNLATAHLEAAVRSDPELASRVEVERIDLPYSLGQGRLDRDALEWVSASDPDWLGLSCYSWDMEALLSLAAELHATKPSVRILAGGPSATFLAHDLLEHNVQLDAIVRGEGEDTLRQVLAHDSVEGVLGVTWRHADGSIREEADRAPVDLAKTPSALLGGFLVPPKQNLLFEFTRGCIYRCTYCAWKSQSPGIRHIPDTRVRDELRWAVERGYEHAFLIDSAINNDDDWLDRFARSVEEIDRERQLALSYFINHALVTEKQVAALSKIQAHEITVGLETVNPSASRAAGRKPVDRAQFTQAMEWIGNVAPATLSIMLGMPGDNLDGFRRTLDFIAELAEKPGAPRVRMARVHWMMIAPGSQMWTRAEQYGLTIARNGIPYVLGSETFPTDDLVRALHLLREHPRSDLFVWEDAEPLGMIDESLPAMFFSGGDHLGGRSGARISHDDVLRAIRPLVPGRPLRNAWRVGNLQRRHGWPVVVLEGENGKQVLLQVRPRNAEPSPLARTREFDLVWLPSREPTGEPTGEEHRLVKALVDLVRKNENG